jgi:hypothetical protein
MGVGGISLMSTVSLRLREVADNGLACWYILLGLAGLTAGRAVDVALWTAGRSILAIEAIMICYI